MLLTVGLAPCLPKPLALAQQLQSPTDYLSPTLPQARKWSSERSSWASGYQYHHRTPSYLPDRPHKIAFPVPFPALLFWIDLIFT